MFSNLVNILKENGILIFNFDSFYPANNSPYSYFMALKKLKNNKFELQKIWTKTNDTKILKIDTVTYDNINLLIESIVSKKDLYNLKRLYERHCIRKAA